MHRTTPNLLASVLLGAVLCAPAFADPPTPTSHYRWKDGSGVVHFGDTIPSSALAGGYDIVDDQGLVIRHVSRELSPSERREAAAQAARTAAAKRAVQQHRVEDAQLLAAYPTDKDLERSQQAQLKQIQTDIGTLEINLRSQENTLTELLAHAADLEHSGNPLPPYVNKRIAEQRDTVRGERSALAQQRADLASTKEQLAVQLQRYRELRAKTRSDDSPPQE